MCMAKIGRPKKTLKKYTGAKSRGLRLKYYSDVPSSDGKSISGHADQYGRILKLFVDENRVMDYKPTGISIAANH